MAVTRLGPGGYPIAGLSRTFSLSIVETASAVDLLNSTALFSGAIVEITDAIDHVSSRGAFLLSILESVSAFDTANGGLAPPVVPILSGIISYLLMFRNAGQGQGDSVITKYYKPSNAINIGCCPNTLVYDLTNGMIDNRWGIFLTFPAPVIPELYFHPNLELLAVSPVSLAVETFVIINNLDHSVNDYQFIVSGMGLFPIPKSIH